MKRIVLFMAVLFLAGTAAQANMQKQLNHHNGITKSIKKSDYRHRRGAPIIFVENRITFLIYPNGEIDYRTPRRRAHAQHDWNRYNIYAPGHSRSYNRHRGLIKNYDYYGRLRRIGNNYISYNRFDQVRKIGSVYIQYNRRGLVSTIGGLSIFYGKHGRIRNIEGDVHYRGCGFCGVDGCTGPHDSYYDFDYRSDHFKDRWNGSDRERKRNKPNHYKKHDK